MPTRDQHSLKGGMWSQVGRISAFRGFFCLSDHHLIWQICFHLTNASVCTSRFFFLQYTAIQMLLEMLLFLWFCVFGQPIFHYRGVFGVFVHFWKDGPKNNDEDMASCLWDASIPSTASAPAWEEGWFSSHAWVIFGRASSPTRVRDSWPLLFSSAQTCILRCCSPVCIKHGWYLQDSSPKCQQCFSMYTTTVLLRVLCCYFKFRKPPQQTRGQVKFLFSFALSLTYLFPLVRFLSFAHFKN